MDEDQDWRLKAELDTDVAGGRLDRLIGHVRDPDVMREIDVELPHEVVVTHDGKLVFAYAAREASLVAARRVIEGVLARDGVNASIVVSHWDEEFDEWRQTDPPASEETKRVAVAAQRDGEQIEKRTMVASTGKAVRAEVEHTMLDWAAKLGLECEISEHPHLLTTQVAFTVTGPKRKIDEFADGLRAEEVATMRTEREVMISPL